MGRVKTGIQVLDAMTTRPITVDPHVTIQEAAMLMQQHDVGSLAVMQDKQILGIITEQDLVRRSITKALDVGTTPVGLIMTRDMVTVNPSMDILETLLLMKDANVRHIPVLDGDTMVGFITSKDILKLQPQLFDLFADAFEIREQERKFIRYTASEEEY